MKRYGFFSCLLFVPWIWIAVSHSSVGPVVEIDRRFPELHRCYDTGEAYSAAYLITKEHLLQTKTSYNLTWVNCEMGSIIFTYQNSRAPKSPGGVVQSLDMLDFSVIHLSAYERLIKRHSRMIPRKLDMNVTQKMQHVSDLLKRSVRKRHHSILSSEKNNQANQDLLQKLNRTVAYMPFLGFTNGAGHSVLANRFRYLDACFWSIYAYFPHVVVAVNSKVDYDYCREKSGLPFYDVLFLDDLPKPASLPVATSLAVKSRILNGSYDFDYFYFTESDQILMLRNPQQLFESLMEYPRYVLLPHRLIPYPELIREKWVRRPAVFLSDSSHGWSDLSCCLPAGQRCETRDSWVKIQASEGNVNVSSASYPVSILPIYDLKVALGNANFLQEVYHSCKLFDHRVERCDEGNVRRRRK